MSKNMEEENKVPTNAELLKELEAEKNENETGPNMIKVMETYRRGV